MKRDSRHQTHTRIRNARIRFAPDTQSAPPILLALLAIGGLLIAGGFIYAVRQHYGAVALGYQSEEMRREKTRLMEEQSRLLAAREQVSSPARLESSARALGMKFASPMQIKSQSPSQQQQQQQAASSQSSGRPRLVPAVAVAKARLSIN